MSYSNAYFKNDELDFPHPPLWLVWTREDNWTEHKPELKGKGKIRHMPTLAKAKTRVRDYTVAGANRLAWLNRSGCAVVEGEFYEDWAIYEWTGEKYELRYSGKAGEHKKHNALFQTVVRKGEGLKERVIPEEDRQAAIDYILRKREASTP